MPDTDNNQKELDGLWAGYTYAITKFDEQSLLISSGALGLSLTFIKDIVPLDKACCMSLFYISISLFLVTIILGFINHFTSSGIHKKAYEDTLSINRMKEDKKSEQEIYDVSKKGFDYRERATKVIARINKFIACTLVAGLFFLVFYCIVNISEYREHKEQKSNCHCHQNKD